MIKSIFEITAEMVPFQKSNARKKLGWAVICNQTGDYFKNAYEVAQYLGVSWSYIKMQISGYKTHVRGFTFRYASKEEIEKVSKLI